MSGLLVLAFSVGLGRVLATGPGRRWGPRLFAFYGLVLVAASVFTTDPMYGFPPGASGRPVTAASRSTAR